jgi:enoyl-CoA hydratase/carnithine racemase
MTVSLQTNGPLAWIRLERPEQMNALNREALLELERRLAEVGSDETVRVLVITGSGKAFCAGADLKAVTGPSEPGEADFLDVAARVFAVLRHHPKPVIAAVNGLAMAGGLELALCCDLIVAAQSARIGDAHANFGVFPGGGGAAVLPRRLPLNIAKQLLFTGDTLPASALTAHGLVNEVVADAELEPAVQALGEKIAAKSPLVLARMKRVANAAADKAQADALREELLELRDHMRSWDFAEGLRAFAEKRKPAFEGR